MREVGSEKVGKVRYTRAACTSCQKGFQHMEIDEPHLANDDRRRKDSGCRQRRTEDRAGSDRLDWSRHHIVGIGTTR